MSNHKKHLIISNSKCMHKIDVFATLNLYRNVYTCVMYIITYIPRKTAPILYYKY